jgi:hypothetical protein
MKRARCSHADCIAVPMSNGACAEHGGQDYDFDVLRRQIDELMMRVAAQAWRDLDEQWRKRWET